MFLTPPDYRCATMVRPVSAAVLTRTVILLNVRSVDAIVERVDALRKKYGDTTLIALEQQLRREVTPAPASQELVQTLTNAALQLPEHSRVLLGSAVLNSVYGTRTTDVETLLRGCAWLEQHSWPNIPLALCSALLKGEGAVTVKHWGKLQQAATQHIESLADQRAIQTVHPFPPLTYPAAPAHLAATTTTAQVPAAATPRRKHRKRTADGTEELQQQQEVNWGAPASLPRAASSQLDMALQWSQQHDVPDLSQALQAASALGLLQQQQQQQQSLPPPPLQPQRAAAGAATSSPKRVNLSRDRQ